MPVVLLPWILTALSGAFVGAQINNFTTPAADTDAQTPSIQKMMIYAGGALLLYYGAQKTGLIK